MDQEVHEANDVIGPHGWTPHGPGPLEQVGSDFLHEVNLPKQLKCGFRKMSFIMNV